MKNIIGAIALISTMNFAYALDGNLNTFISPDEELVVEIHGKAARSVQKFFESRPEPISPNLLRAGLRRTAWKGIRAGIRAGYREGSKELAEKAIGEGIPVGVKVGIQMENTAEGIRVGLGVARETIRATTWPDISSSVKRHGIRAAMGRMMEFRDDRIRWIYRIVIQKTGADPMYPHTGRANVLRQGKNRLKVTFDGQTSEVLQSVGSLEENNIFIDCKKEECSLIFDL